MRRGNLTDGQSRDCATHRLSSRSSKIGSVLKLCSPISASRGVKRQLARRNLLAQFTLQHLTGRVAGKSRQVAQVFRFLVARDAFLAEGAELTRSNACAFAQNNHSN